MISYKYTKYLLKKLTERNNSLPKGWVRNGDMHMKYTTVSSSLPHQGYGSNRYYVIIRHTNRVLNRTQLGKELKRSKKAKPQNHRLRKVFRGKKGSTQRQRKRIWTDFTGQTFLPKVSILLKYGSQNDCLQRGFVTFSV